MPFLNSSVLTRGEGLYEKREEEGGDLNKRSPLGRGLQLCPQNSDPEVLKQVFFITGTSCSVAALSYLYVLTSLCTKS